MTRIERIDAARFRVLAADAASVYGAAMRRSPEVVIQRRDIIAVHVSYPGFIASGAFEPASGAFEAASGAFDPAPGGPEPLEPAAEVAAATTPLVGFGYGYLGAPGQWWHDIVARGLGRKAAIRWLQNGFELAELHVLPDHQGRGLGRALLADLMSRAAADHVVLSTPDVESPARALYRSCGFTDLLAALQFPGSSERYAIMGVDL